MDAEIMQTNGLNIKDWDATIYRVFPIRWFRDMVETKTMGLARPSRWDDPFENFYLKCKVRLATGEIGSLKLIASKWYGQCWTKNRESDAMWRIYSPDKCGVRVSTTIS